MQALKARFLVWHSSTFLTRLGKANGDGLLATFHRATLSPFPDFKVPFLRRCIALSTVLPADLPYFRLPELFL